MKEPDTDLQAVARAYRASRKLSSWDHPAYEAAVAVLRERYPDMTRDAASRRAAVLIGEASRRYGQWLYGGKPKAHPPV